MTTHENPIPGASRRRRPLTLLSLGLASLLLATGCAGGQDAGEEPEPSAQSSQSTTQQAGESEAPRKAAGEGQGEPGALEGVHVTEAENGEPEVRIETPIETDQPSTRVLTAGEGEMARSGDVVKFSTVIVDPDTGEVEAENFSSEPQTTPLDDRVQQMFPEMFELFATNGVGSVVAAYSPERQEPTGPAPSASSSASSSPSASPSTTTVPAQLFVYRIDAIVPRTAQGAEVTERDDRLPEVSVGEDGTPTIAKPEGSPPAEMVVQPLIQGEGAEVGEDDTVTVQYSGVTWSDGETFDSSWERGASATFSLNGVIPGWKEGLAGQKVGSRVLLSIPADKAYGEQGSPPKIGPNEPLLFVVDILDAQAPAAPQN